MSTSLSIRLNTTHQCCPNRLNTTGHLVDLVVRSYIQVNRDNITMSAHINSSKAAKEVAGNHEASLRAPRDVNTHTLHNPVKEKQNMYGRQRRSRIYTVYEMSDL